MYLNFSVKSINFNTNIQKNNSFIQEKRNKKSETFHLNATIMIKASEVERIRKTKKITQDELVAQIGMTKSGYQNALRNNDFKASVLGKIADTLNVPVNVFYEGHANQQNINAERSQDSQIVQNDAENIKQGDFSAGHSTPKSSESEEKLAYEKKLLEQKVEGLQREIDYLKDMLKQKDEMLKYKDDMIEMYKKQAGE